jgi:hypothetical protein
MDLRAKRGKNTKKMRKLKHSVFFCFFDDRLWHIRISRNSGASVTWTMDRKGIIRFDDFTDQIQFNAYETVFHNSIAILCF